MTLTVSLIDINNELCQEATSIQWPANVTMCFRSNTSVRDIEVEYGMAFVAPSDAFGCMSGSVSDAIRLMFPGVDTIIKQKVREHLQYRGRMLRVGEALTVEVPQYSGVYVILTPTCVIGEKVGATDNAKQAMLAVTDEIKAQSNISHLVLPGLCTGSGGMSARDFVKQASEALRAFDV